MLKLLKMWCIIELIICENPDDNSGFVLELINKVEYSKNDNYYWVIADLDLVPSFHGDYKGNGGAISEIIVDSFHENFANTGIAIMSYSELVNLHKDKQCIRNAVIVCYSKQISIWK